MENAADLKKSDAVEIGRSIAGPSLGDSNIELPRPPPAASTIGIRLPSDVIRAIHNSVCCIESCSLVCKVVGSVFSSRLVKDYIQGALLSSVEVVNVSPLGRGCFRVQFKSQLEATEVLALSPVRLNSALGFFVKWTHGMDLSSLDSGLTVTARFPGLLPEYVPYIVDIGKCFGYVVGDVLVPEGEDRTPSLRMVLPPSLAKDPPQFLSFPSIHGGEMLQRVFFIGLPGHCFVCGRKGHVAADCSRRRVSPEERQKATVLEGSAQPCQAAVEEETCKIGKQRSDLERARRRAAKKRRRQARRTEESRGLMVYRRKVPPLGVPSSSTHPLPPPEPNPESGTQQSSSSADGGGSSQQSLFNEGSSSYDENFPILINSCKEVPVKELRRSVRKKKSLAML